VHLKVVACEIAAREIYFCAARSVNTLNIDLLTQGLHDNSDVMRDELQKHIDGIDTEHFDAVLLGYGLCNNGIAGLQARDLELVIPRAHDCITFFLGSKERYAEEFDGHPGTYYYTSGWLEYPERRGEKPELSQKSGFGATLHQMREYEKLVEKYGEDNAKYLMEMMGEWQQKYSRLAFIDFGFLEHLALDERAREIGDRNGWNFARLEGRLDLLQNWLDGRWDEGEFLRVPPGHGVAADYKGQIIKAVPADSAEGDARE
jgi:Protein of unknown function (DUF1638)